MNIDIILYIEQMYTDITLYRKYRGIFTTVVWLNEEM